MSELAQPQTATDPDVLRRQRQYEYENVRMVVDSIKKRLLETLTPDQLLQASVLSADIILAFGVECHKELLVFRKLSNVSHIMADILSLDPPGPQTEIES